MNGLKKHELFTVPQMERVKEMEITVIAWMNELADDEHLVIGLPEVIGKWSECTPLVVGPGMQEQFLDWLRESAEAVRGPFYNLPKLNAHFLCAVVHKDFDPRSLAPPEDASEALLGTLSSLGESLTKLETKAA